MQGRTDLTQVKSSCQTLINFQVDSHGGLRRRLGTRFVAETKFSDLISRLIPFIFSGEDSWVLEFGNYYIRFFRDGGVLIDPGAPADLPRGRLEHSFLVSVPRGRRRGYRSHG